MKDAWFYTPLFEGELLCHTHKYLQRSIAAAPIETFLALKKENKKRAMILQGTVQ